jgi:hypothetical protein
MKISTFFYTNVCSAIRSQMTDHAADHQYICLQYYVAGRTGRVDQHSDSSVSESGQLRRLCRVRRPSTFAERVQELNNNFIFSRGTLDTPRRGPSPMSRSRPAPNARIDTQTYGRRPPRARARVRAGPGVYNFFTYNTETRFARLICDSSAATFGKHAAASKTRPQSDRFQYFFRVPRRRRLI